MSAALFHDENEQGVLFITACHICTTSGYWDQNQRKICKQCKMPVLTPFPEDLLKTALIEALARPYCTNPSDINSWQFISYDDGKSFVLENIGV